MQGSGSNLSFNILSVLKNLGRQAKAIISKPNLGEQVLKNVKPTQTNPTQSLTNTNSNVHLNQSTLTNNAVNQTALNSSNQPQALSSADSKSNANTQVRSTPSQIEFQGPSDLPSYAGVANMSLKSWIAGQDSKTYAKTETQEKQLTATLEGIKGFQNKNSEGGFDADADSGGTKQQGKFKNLLLLSHIFSKSIQSGTQETEFLVNVYNFKKLGSSLAERGSSGEESLTEVKLSPPLPNELQSFTNIDPLQIKYLHQLLALPSEFPECLRLFAKDGIEINLNDLNKFLVQRAEIVQGQILGGDIFLNNSIANFAALLNQADFTLLLPLVLLYYPLPLPKIEPEYDFIQAWKKKKKSESDVPIIASCEIYYLSKVRGRFLLKFELNEKEEFTFNVQTAKENNGIVNDLENAISESMFLLERPPLLTDLNILLTKEIYKATDIDEELSIVSTGPLRLEIILATYAALVVLNKLSVEPDPAGLIEMAG